MELGHGNFGILYGRSRGAGHELGHTGMNATCTVRFVLADDAYTGAKRGDILLENTWSGNFEVA